MGVLITPSRDRWSSEMELRSTVHVLGDPTVLIFSRSRISMFLRWRFSSLQVAIGETPRWSWINGPEQTSIWRLRLFRDFAYREIERLGNPIPLNFHSMTWWSFAMCPMDQRSTTVPDGRSRFLHSFGELDDSWTYPPCRFTISNDYWAFVDTPDPTAQIFSRFRCFAISLFLPSLFFAIADLFHHWSCHQWQAYSLL